LSRDVVVPERDGAPFRQNIFEPERRSGKYCLSQPERWYCRVPENQLALLLSYIIGPTRNLVNWFSGKS